jgi:hypothetical protein|eukprot:COSAG02_NODE_554_length_20414_cov_67.356535_6_plen_96_part_00
MTVEPEPEREPEWAIPDPEWVPTSAEVIGTYLLKGPGSDLGTFWSCSVTVSRAGGGKLDCDIVDHWSEPSGSTTVRENAVASFTLLLFTAPFGRR